MKILLINHYAGSSQYGMEYRPYYLAREWIKIGHKATIVGASFSHLRSKQPEVDEELIENIRYIWIKTPRYKGNGIKRVWNMLTFIVKLLGASRKLSKKIKPNVVIASSTYPLDIYPAYLIAYFSKAKLIFEVHDLWPLTPIELGKMPRWHPFIIMMQIAEDFAYKRADKVISILPKALDYMVSRGLDPKKFIHIPNGVSIKEWEQSNQDVPAEHRELIKKLKREGKFIVGYTGNHGVANALDVLIKSAILLKNKSVAIVLVGNGPEKGKLKKMVYDIGLSNVFFLPPVSKSSIPRLLNMMDVLYIGWEKQPLYRYGISPNKLTDYMMAGKPIIHSVEAGNDLVKEASCGISILAEDSSQVASAIEELMNMPEEERRIMGERGKKYVEKYYSYGKLAEEYAKLF